MKKFKYANKYKDMKGWCLIDPNSRDLVKFIFDYESEMNGLDLPAIFQTKEEALKFMNLAKYKLEVAGLELRIVYFDKKKC